MDAKGYHIRLYPAPDVPGQWIAEIEELDLVTQGNDAAHALEMLADALRIVQS